MKPSEKFRGARLFDGTTNNSETSEMKQVVPIRCSVFSENVQYLWFNLYFIHASNLFYVKYQSDE